MIRTLFICAIMVPGFVAALSSRYAALLLYLWFALFRPQDWLWIDITKLRVSLVLGLVLIGPALVTGLFPNVTHPLSVGMLAFLATTLIAQVGAIQPATGWVWIDFLTRLLLACLLLVTLASESKRLAGVLAVIAGSMGFHAAKAGLAFILGGGIRFADGLAGAFFDNNGYALGTVMIMPLLLATAQNIDVIYSGRFAAWIARGFYVSVPLCAFAVIGTYSRGGFLALAAASIAFVVLQRRRTTAVVALTVITAIALAFVPIPHSYVDRLQTIQTYEQVGDESAMSRTHFWRVGIRMGLEHPLGIGVRQYEAAYDRYDTLYGRYGRHRAVHSSHVQVFAELGFVGLAVWIGLFVYAFHACLRVRRLSRLDHLDPRLANFLFTAANGLLVSMVAFLVAGAFLSAALNDVTWLTFAMIAALDRTAATESAATPAPAPARRSVPLAFRVVDAYAPMRGGTA